MIRNRQEEGTVNRSSKRGSQRRTGGCLLGLLLLILVPGGAHADNAGDNPWSFLGFTRYRDAIFIDKTRLTRSAPGKVVVPALIKPTPDSIFRRRLRREIPAYKESLENFYYLVLVMELDCPKQRLRFLVIQFRDAADRALQTTSDARAPWKAVKPGSLWQQLAGAVCP